MMCETQNA